MSFFFLTIETWGINIIFLKYDFWRSEIWSVPAFILTVNYNERMIVLLLNIDQADPNVPLCGQLKHVNSGVFKIMVLNFILAFSLKEQLSEMGSGKMSS